jgi:hypothetical protein
MKIKLLIILLIIVVIIIACVYFLTPKSLICTNYVIDESHKITDKTKIPQGTWDNMTSPNGNKLEIIELIKSSTNCQDCAWRRAMYSKEENKFWVADMPGMYFSGWYGSFDGKPCLW